MSKCCVGDSNGCSRKKKGLSTEGISEQKTGSGRAIYQINAAEENWPYSIVSLSSEGSTQDIPGEL